ncbi:MAG: hypothetical protein AVDCRST_MAG17-2227, partial [uncultured Solirubrobacterales bacterium]
ECPPRRQAVTTVRIAHSLPGRARRRARALPARRLGRRRGRYPSPCGRALSLRTLTARSALRRHAPRYRLPGARRHPPAHRRGRDGATPAGDL